MSSLPLPSEPRRGDPVTADWARRVAAALRSLRLRGGPGIRVTTGPDGTTVSAARAGNGGGAAVAHEPVVAILPRIEPGPTRATLMSLDGSARRSGSVWALELAGDDFDGDDVDGEGGACHVIAYPVSRFVAASSEA